MEYIGISQQVTKTPNAFRNRTIRYPETTPTMPMGYIWYINAFILGSVENSLTQDTIAFSRVTNLIAGPCLHLRERTTSNRGVRRRPTSTRRPGPSFLHSLPPPSLPFFSSTVGILIFSFVFRLFALHTPFIFYFFSFSSPSRAYTTLLP